MLVYMRILEIGLLDLHVHVLIKLRERAVPCRAVPFRTKMWGNGRGLP